jgi:hypothetical protein
MKTPEYTEGPKALENFERLAMAVMQAPRLNKKGKRKDKPTASQSESKIFRHAFRALDAAYGLS